MRWGEGVRVGRDKINGGFGEARPKRVRFGQDKVSHSRSNSAHPATPPTESPSPAPPPTTPRPPHSVYVVVSLPALTSLPMLSSRAGMRFLWSFIHRRTLKPLTWGVGSSGAAVGRRRRLNRWRAEGPGPLC